MSRISRYLDKLEEDRCEVARQTIMDRYYILLSISGMDIDLSRKNRYCSLLWVLFNYTILFMMTVDLLYTAYLLRDDFNQISFEVNYAFFVVLAITFLMVAHVKRKGLCELHRRLGNGIFEYAEPQKETEDMKKFMLQLQFQKRVLVYLAGFLIIIVFFVVAGPIIDIKMGVGYPDMIDENGVNRQLSVPLYMPLNLSDRMTYIIGTASIATVGFIVGCAFGGGSLIHFLTAHTVLLEQKILCCSVKAVPRRAFNMFCKYNKIDTKTLTKKVLYKIEEYQNCVYECLKENVKHHQQIKSLVEIYQDVCSAPVYLTVAIYSLTIALSLVNLSQGVSKFGSSLAFALSILAQFVYVLFFGTYGQYLLSMSEELRWEVYSLPWYEFNAKNRRLVIMLNLGNYNPVCFLAWRIRLDMEIITDVLNAAYSFFNFLQLGKALHELER